MFQAEYGNLLEPPGQLSAWQPRDPDGSRRDVRSRRADPVGRRHRPRRPRADRPDSNAGLALRVATTSRSPARTWCCHPAAWPHGSAPTSWATRVVLLAPPRARSEATLTVDFGSFVRVVDALGGIEVDVAHRIDDEFVAEDGEEFAAHFPAGRQRLVAGGLAAPRERRRGSIRSVSLAPPAVRSVRLGDQGWVHVGDPELVERELRDRFLRDDATDAARSGPTPRRGVDGSDARVAPRRSGGPGR